MTTFSSCCPLYMVTLTTASWWWWLLDKETCLKMDTLLFTVFTYSLQHPVSQTGGTFTVRLVARQRFDP